MRGGPDLDMAPVRVNVSLPGAVLDEVDHRAKLAGMIRSAYLLTAVQVFMKRSAALPARRVKSTKAAKSAKGMAKRTRLDA